MTDAYRWETRAGEAGRRLARLAGIACLAAALGACSIALPSFMGGDGPEETTGSVAKPSAETRFSAELGTEDRRRAKGALALALDPQGNGRPVKWDNPETGAAGDVAPLGSPFVENDEVCRRFTASVEPSSGRISRLAGRACRVSGGEWLLKQVGSEP